MVMTEPDVVSLPAVCECERRKGAWARSVDSVDKLDFIVNQMLQRKAVVNVNVGRTANITMRAQTAPAARQRM